MFRENEEMYPQAKRFIPERWLKNRPEGASAVGSAEDFDAVSHGKRNPFAFLPFGFGPRSCVGKRFAELEMETLIAKVCRIGTRFIIVTRHQSKDWFLASPQSTPLFTSFITCQILRPRSSPLPLSSSLSLQYCFQLDIEPQNVTVSFTLLFP
jgi:hypothetical protein